MDRAIDIRTKFGGILSNVKASLRRIEKNVDEKIVENNRQLAQLSAAKNEMTSYRDNFLPTRDSSASEREFFFSYVEECVKNLVAPCASAAQLEEQYEPLDQAKLKLSIIDCHKCSNWPTSACIDGSINLLVLDLEKTESYSAAEDVRRVVAYALITSDKSGNNEKTVPKAENELSGIRAPSPAPRNSFRISLPLAQPISPPPPIRQSDLSVADSTKQPSSVYQQNIDEFTQETEQDVYEVSSFDEYRFSTSIPTSITPPSPIRQSDLSVANSTTQPSSVYQQNIVAFAQETEQNIYEVSSSIPASTPPPLPKSSPPRRGSLMFSSLSHQQLSTSSLTQSAQVHTSPAQEEFAINNVYGAKLFKIIKFKNLLICYNLNNRRSRRSAKRR